MFLLQEGHSREVYSIAFQVDGSLAATWYGLSLLIQLLVYIHQRFCHGCQRDEQKSLGQEFFVELENFRNFRDNWEYDTTV